LSAAAARSAFTNAPAMASEPFIFQLPAMSCRILSSRNRFSPYRPKRTSVQALGP
jgi:hypothetical protein